MIKQCKCGDYRSPAAFFQNKRYGYGMRVHNPCELPGGNKGAVCTVCSDRKSVTKKADKKAD